jgi:hypothetical protein
MDPKWEVRIRATDARGVDKTAEYSIRGKDVQYILTVALEKSNIALNEVHEVFIHRDWDV